MMSNQEIIVLGGGLVGKTAALTFAQKGFKVFHVASSLAPKNSAGAQSLVDPAWQSRVFAISTSSQQLLQQLQVWDALPQERIQVVSDMRIFGDEAHIDRSLHFSAFEAGVPQLSWIVEASLIEHGLDLASRFCQTLTRVEAEVLDIKILEKGVQVCTDHGNFGAQVIIAADGANSPTRTHFGIEISNENYVHSAVVANLECSQAHLQTAYQWFLPDGDVLALLPLPGQRASLVWSTQHENAQSLVNCANTEPEAFCQRIAQAAQGMVTHELGSLRLLNLAQSYPLRKLRAKRLIGPSVDPKIILVGDSAHAMHPLAGQGLNLGLRDIIDLNHVLNQRESFRSLDDSVLLRRYERMRAHDIDAILGVTHHLHRLFLNPTLPIRWLRNRGLQLVNLQPQLKRTFIAKAMG
jgi:ubiquinone biosynthesis UbiH/UbiF/VisC/COQ6 family hydroxylase